MTDDTREVHEHLLSLLSPGDATSVLDLGCGRGEHLRMLAGTMPANARLVGIDLRENLLEEARAAVDGDERFVFLQHDVNERLPFEDGAFDRVLSVNALEAIPAKDVFAREVYRVLEPAGRLVCAHYDWESMLYDGADKEAVRRVVRGFAEWKQSWMATSDGWMGRRLWSVFQESRVFDGRVDAYTHTSTSYESGCYGWERSRDCKGLIKRGMVTEAEYDAFIDGLERLAEQQRYFFAITMFSYVGVKAA